MSDIVNLDRERFARSYKKGLQQRIAIKTDLKNLIGSHAQHGMPVDQILQSLTETLIVFAIAINADASALMEHMAEVIRDEITESDPAA